MRKLSSDGILGISLLSIEEYKAAEDNIPPLDEWWWLRSPGRNSMEATCIPRSSIINFDNYWVVDVINGIGYTTVNLDLGVRPALQFNRKSVELSIGTKVQFKGFTWTHISEGLLLCDDIITLMPFRNAWRADDADKYEASDVKKYLDSWLLSKTPPKHEKDPELSQEEKLRIYHEQAHSLHIQDAEKRVTDYIKAKGYEPDRWLNKFDIDRLAAMFEEKQRPNVTDNDTWLTVFRQYINEHRIPIENTYEVCLAVEGQSCVKVKATSEKDAETKAIKRMKETINRMENKNSGEFRNIDWRITDTRLVEPKDEK